MRGDQKHDFIPFVSSLFVLEERAQNRNARKARYPRDRLAADVAHKAAQNDRLIVRDTEESRKLLLTHLSGVDVALSSSPLNRSLDRWPCLHFGRTMPWQNALR